MDFLYQLQNLRTPFWDSLCSLLTNLGGEIILVAILCILYWCLNKELAYKLCFTYFLSGLLVQGVKIVCRIERPWIRDTRLSVVESAADGATGYSFPSGHTQAAASLYGALAIHLKKWWSYLAGFVLTALVMFTRMYLGCHTPQDVVAAFCITIVTAAAVDFVYDRFLITKAHRKTVFIIIEVISAALIALSLFQVISGRTTPELAMDCFKSAGAGIGFGIAFFLETGTVRFQPKDTRTVGGQILKFVIGIGVALALKQALKLFLCGNDYVNIAVNIARYTVVILWIVWLYPMIFTKIQSKRKDSGK